MSVSQCLLLTLLTCLVLAACSVSERDATATVTEPTTTPAVALPTPASNLLGSDPSAWELLGLGEFRPHPEALQTDASPLTVSEVVASTSDWFSDVAILDAFSGEPLVQFCAGGLGSVLSPDLFNVDPGTPFEWSVRGLPGAAWHATHLVLEFHGDSPGNDRLTYPITLRVRSEVTATSGTMTLDNPDCSLESGAEIGGLINADQVLGEFLTKVRSTMPESEAMPPAMRNFRGSPASNLAAKPIPDWLLGDPISEPQLVESAWSEFLGMTRLVSEGNFYGRNEWLLCPDMSGVIVDDAGLGPFDVRRPIATNVGWPIEWSVRTSPALLWGDVVLTLTTKDAPTLLIGGASLRNEAIGRISFRDGEFVLDVGDANTTLQILDAFSDLPVCAG